jgi:hypothetical protein
VTYVAVFPTLLAYGSIAVLTLLVESGGCRERRVCAPRSLSMRLHACRLPSTEHARVCASIHAPMRQVADRKPEFILDTKDVLAAYFRVDPKNVTIRQNMVFNTPQVGASPYAKTWSSTHRR